jgi:hypothetical protein
MSVVKFLESYDESVTFLLLEEIEKFLHDSVDGSIDWEAISKSMETHGKELSAKECFQLWNFIAYGTFTEDYQPYAESSLEETVLNIDETFQRYLPMDESNPVSVTNTSTYSFYKTSTNSHVTGDVPVSLLQFFSKSLVHCSLSLLR